MDTRQRRMTRWMFCGGLARLFAAGLVGGLALTAIAGEAAGESIMVCVFEQEAGFVVEKGRTRVTHDPFGPNRVVFAGLDSPSPTMKGELGESRLSVLRREPDTVWLMERPSLGGVNVFTLFQQTGQVVASKQYRPLEGIRDVTLALVWIGHCE
jgi:hypothetical protein